MQKHFNCIGILGKPRFFYAMKTHKELFFWLQKKGYQVIVEKEIFNKLNIKNLNCIGTLEDIGKTADLAIVIGGDGNMLNAARFLSNFDIKIIGINRGNLGFLTDLDHKNMYKQLNKILKGDYLTENRFLLEIKEQKKERLVQLGTAINEIVLHLDKVAKMIEFAVYIDEKFAFSQRADGLIISTPTGSTAYALSAGGPIVDPSIDGIILIPMFPHTLSARPLVINNNSIIRLQFSKLISNLEISCDSHIIIPYKTGKDIVIQRSKSYFKLVHPKEYNYFNILSSKLNWSKNNKKLYT
ncbi:NAD(+) kinase [Candidatus Tachikawaea gelatinosa]|uniref:NAD kinase n=1 Tax=Candidatus Tachikawaea gelatinosa TaxID=1410383 RepID=A0A090BWE9_9ENTR|nr:NAD(+) kinase [Candidatus Tachikawaea gelatinosa]BAP58486.1 probable inorganic polyphosphate/ATP-NAD kinase [Candidatus Tachikawaea gelatinosa]